MEFDEILEATKPVPVTFAGKTINFEYYPARFSNQLDKYMRKVAASVEKKLAIMNKVESGQPLTDEESALGCELTPEETDLAAARLSHLLASSDITVKGEPLPLTPENITRFGWMWIMRITKGINEDLDPN